MIDRQILGLIVKALLEAVEASRVVAILRHGSTVFNPHTQPNDIDIVVVLNGPQSGDCNALGKSINQFRANLPPIQFNLFYMEEIPTNGDFFSMNTSGALFAWHLRQADVLHGHNPFFDVNGPSPHALLVSSLDKLQQYTSWVRTLLFDGRALTAQEVGLLAKRSINCVKDVLIARYGVWPQENESVLMEARRFLEADMGDLFGTLDFLVSVGLEQLCREPQLSFVERCLALHEWAWANLRAELVSKTKCRYLA